jgi:hypothetical protein
MSLRIAFTGGPLHGEVLSDPYQLEACEPALDLPRHVFRVTSHGRVGTSFDIFDPHQLQLAAPVGHPLPLHHYRVDQRQITDDATILVVAGYVGPTGREIRPSPTAIRRWAGLLR